jgi:hypothetical protein
MLFEKALEREGSDQAARLPASMARDLEVAQ